MCKWEECPDCGREFKEQVHYDMQYCTFCNTFTVGDTVEKTSGYKWPGVIVSDFNNLAGQRRLVVECTAKAVEGAMHIYSPNQIRKTD